MTKYKNKKVNYEGITFDSKKECWRYQELRILEKSGIIQKLELQKRFVIVPKIKGVKGSRDKHYICDFFYYDTVKNKWIVEDVKGAYTAKLELFRLKWQLMQYLYPDYEYIVYD